MDQHELCKRVPAEWKGIVRRGADQALTYQRVIDESWKGPADGGLFANKIL